MRWRAELHDPNGYGNHRVMQSTLFDHRVIRRRAELHDPNGYLTIVLSGADHTTARDTRTHMSKVSKMDKVRIANDKWRRAVERAHQAHTVTEVEARAAFERARWPNGVTCPRCGTNDVRAVPSARPQPWACRDCKWFFSVRYDTIMAASNRSLRLFYIAAEVYEALAVASALQVGPFIELVAEPPPVHRAEFTWDGARRLERVNEQWRNLARLWHSIRSVEGSLVSTPESRRKAAERMTLPDARRETARAGPRRVASFEAVLRAGAERLGVEPEKIARDEVVADLLGQGYVVGVDGIIYRP